MENQFRKRSTKITRPNTYRNSAISRNSSSYSNMKLMLSSKSTDHLLNQAKLCLDNKIIEDRMKQVKLSPSEHQSCCSKEKQYTAQQRRHTFAQSKTIRTSFHRSHDSE